ncbi:MAG: hypothetical protein JNK58_03990 [Phycisphaerae bacterium]|nr:hypothetical protein [Phycisphaerae bacterium]
MAEAVEWVQCKKCGRRQRWAAELAGKTIRCGCGSPILCPRGVDVNEPAARTGADTFSDTIVEAADSESARSPYEALDREYFEIQATTALPPTMEERRANKSFFIWFLLMLFGLSMLIHALITQWQVYIILAALFVPITFWKFFRAKRRWQKGRSISEALSRSLGMDRA